jgi:GTPase
VVRIDEQRSFVIADIPGVIEGAAEGAGLGLQFLKHLSRTGLLLHVVDVKPYESLDTPVDSAKKIIHELELWSDELVSKPRWLVLNKIDRLQDDEVELNCNAIIKGLKWKGPVFKISAINGEGTKELMFAIMNFLDTQRREHSGQD